MLEINFLNQEILTISFAGTEITIEIDDSIYPNSKKIKAILSEMNFSDETKQLANTFKAKEMIWQLRELLKTHLNKMGNRHPDYPILEEEYKRIETANLFLFYGIQYLQGEFHDFCTQFSNPNYGMN